MFWLSGIDIPQMDTVPISDSAILDGIAYSAFELRYRNYGRTAVLPYAFRLTLWSYPVMGRSLVAILRRVELDLPHAVLSCRQVFTVIPVTERFITRQRRMLQLGAIRINRPTWQPNTHMHSGN